MPLKLQNLHFCNSGVLHEAKYKRCRRYVFCSSSCKLNINHRAMPEFSYFISGEAVTFNLCQLFYASTNTYFTRLFTGLSYLYDSIWRRLALIDIRVCAQRTQICNEISELVTSWVLQVAILELQNHTSMAFLSIFKQPGRKMTPSTYPQQCCLHNSVTNRSALCVCMYGIHTII